VNYDFQYKASLHHDPYTYKNSNSTSVGSTDRVKKAFGMNNNNNW